MTTRRRSAGRRPPRRPRLRRGRRRASRGQWCSDGAGRKRRVSAGLAPPQGGAEGASHWQSNRASRRGGLGGGGESEAAPQAPSHPGHRPSVGEDEPLSSGVVDVHSPGRRHHQEAQALDRAALRREEGARVDVRRLGGGERHGEVRRLGLIFSSFTAPQAASAAALAPTVAGERERACRGCVPQSVRGLEPHLARCDALAREGERLCNLHDLKGEVSRQPRLPMHTAQSHC